MSDVRVAIDAVNRKFMATFAQQGTVKLTKS